MSQNRILRMKRGTPWSFQEFTNPDTAYYRNVTRSRGWELSRILTVSLAPLFPSLHHLMVIITRRREKSLLALFVAVNLTDCLDEIRINFSNSTVIFIFYHYSDSESYTVSQSFVLQLQNRGCIPNKKTSQNRDVQKSYYNITSIS